MIYGKRLRFLHDSKLTRNIKRPAEGAFYVLIRIDRIEAYFFAGTTKGGMVMTLYGVAW